MKKFGIMRPETADEPEQENDQVKAEGWSKTISQTPKIAKKNPVLKAYCGAVDKLNGNTKATRFLNEGVAKEVRDRVHEDLPIIAQAYIDGDLVENDHKLLVDLAEAITGTEDKAEREYYLAQLDGTIAKVEEYLKAMTKAVETAKKIKQK